MALSEIDLGQRLNDLRTTMRNAESSLTLLSPGYPLFAFNSIIEMKSAFYLVSNKSGIEPPTPQRLGEYIMN